MRKILFVFIISLFFCPFVYAEDFTNYIVKDIDSGRIFYEKNPDVKKLPASTTKIMTLIVALENSNLSDVVKVSNEILTMDGTNIYLEVGENILMQDLLYGMILRSGNDAAMSVASFVSGDMHNFTVLMNEKVRELGLKNTIFNNPTGLDDYEKNYSSVRDLSSIYSYGYKNKTFREIVSASTYKSSSDRKAYLFNNRAKIVSMYNKCTGAKTGYTPSAGRLLVSSASNGVLDLVIASVGDDYKYKRHIEIFEEIFSKYKNYVILDKDKFKVKSTLDGKLYIKNSFSYPLTSSEYSLVSTKMVFNSKKKGAVGEVLVYLDDSLIHKENIYLEVSRDGFFDKVRAFFRDLLD